MQKRLNELLPGECARIIKIDEKSPIKRRLMELGIRAGKEVLMRRDAPMGDPIEINVMGYNISLRKSEASYVMIESTGEKEEERNREIRTIALVGNPNCGKTTLFNLLTGSRQHVGNWPGVTVEKKEGHFSHKGHNFEIIDLPGIYSLSPNSIEEVVTRNYIIENKPDIVINIIDGTTLEKSLYLSSQLIDSHTPMFIAINMFDEVKQKGIEIDLSKMAELLKMPAVPIAARDETGIGKLLDTVLEQLAQKNEERIHIRYGDDLENAISELEKRLCNYKEIINRCFTRWFAIQLLCGDSEIAKKISMDPDFPGIMEMVRLKIRQLKSIYSQEPEMFIMEQRFGFVMGIMRECVRTRKPELSRIDTTERIDNIVLNKYLSFPLFALILWTTFQLTFSLGGLFGGFISQGIKLAGTLIGRSMPQGILKDLISDGIVKGVGGVLVFLPQILILFLVIAILEDSGYMARVAFIMDRLMHYLGVHGKSFISMFMGIGCNVPGIMAARALENEEDRKVTILINPFMSCSARLPVYVLITGMFFSKTAGTVIFSLYMIGILVAIFTALLLKTFFFKKKSTPFVMELPPYRTPSATSLLLHMWEWASMFLKKMGGVILIGSILIWALGYFPRTADFSNTVKDMQAKALIVSDTVLKEKLHNDIEHQKAMEQLENSYIGIIGKKVQPFFSPLGFDWKEGVAVITGVVGKEVVVSTISVLYGSDKNDSISLKSKMQEGGTTPATAYGFLIFILLYIPCLATIAAVLKETNSVKWTVFSVFYGICVGYLLSYVSRMVCIVVFKM